MLIWKQTIVFSLVNSIYSEKKMPAYCPKTGDNGFLPHAFQFIIHQQFYHFTH